MWVGETSCKYKIQAASDIGLKMEAMIRPRIKSSGYGVKVDRDCKKQAAVIIAVESR